MADGTIVIPFDDQQTLNQSSASITTPRKTNSFRRETVAKLQLKHQGGNTSDYDHNSSHDMDMEPISRSGSLKSPSRSQQHMTFLKAVKDNMDPQTAEHPFKRAVNIMWDTLMGSATLLATLGDPVYILTAPDGTGDPIVGIVTFVLVTMFGLDFLLQMYSHRMDYIFSVFFFLDCLSIVDLGLTGASRLNDGSDDMMFFRLMRLSRVAKMSSRAGRVARFFNLVSRWLKSLFVRNRRRNNVVSNVFSEQELTGLVMNMDSNDDGKIDFEEFITAAEESYGRTLSRNELETMSNVFKELDRDNSGYITVEEIQECFAEYETEYISDSGERGLRVEKDYNNRATKQFVLVVFIIFFVPNVWEALWLRPLQVTDSFDVAAQMVKLPNATRIIQNYFGDSLISIVAGNVTLYSRGYDARRQSEVETASYDDATLRFDTRDDANYTAEVQIVSTFFLATLLLVSNFLMLRQAQILLIKPLEKTMRVVSQIRRNPLAKIATDKEDEQGSDSSRTNENNFVVDVVAKLGKLLQVMVGEAGADIISRNIRREGTVSVIRKGAMIEGTFAFFDIRDFTTITEKLQDEVMVFVNHVAAIIHSAAHAAGGFPNKNVGDAFLIVWKHRKLSYIPEIVEVDDPINAPLPQPLVVAPMNNNAVYGALFSCLHAVLSIRNSVELTSFAQALGFENVRVGCGIHHGWAVEGAVGSFLKVDATYLSPHVNLASRLESATKRYGVELMFSDAVYHNIPSDLHPYVRLLDKVALKGFHGCVDVYGIVGDAMYERLGVNSNMSSRDLRQKVSQFLPFDTLPLTTSVLVPNEGHVDNEDSAKSGTSTNSSSVNKLRAASLVEDVRESSSGNFGSFDTACKANDMYGSAIRKYLSSDWYGCKQRLKQLLYEFPLDRPAELMLKYIELKEMPDGSAPVTFAGFTRADDK